MEKTSESRFKCGLSFLENFGIIIVAISIIVAIICIAGYWIWGIAINLSSGKLSEAFCWFVLGPIITAGFCFFLDFCETMGDSGDGW